MTQIRDAVDQALADAATRSRPWTQPLTDEEWELLVRLGHVARFRRNQATLEQLRDVVVDTRRTYQRRAAPTPGEGDQRTRNRQRGAHRARALAAVFFRHAETDRTDRCGVHGFRRDVLGQRLRPHLQPWIDAQVRRQGAPTIRRGALQLVQVRVDGEIVRRATRQGDTLDRLREVSERLAAFYRWHPADAAAYVLAGTQPPVDAIRGEVRDRVMPFRARSAIVLTIDPTTTPAEVRAAYSQLRREAFGRMRRLGAKHAELAVFFDEHREDAVSHQLAAWNARAPRRQRYRFPSVFHREAELAFRALVELEPHRRRR